MWLLCVLLGTVSWSSLWVIHQEYVIPCASIMCFIDSFWNLSSPTLPLPSMVEVLLNSVCTSTHARECIFLLQVSLHNHMFSVGLSLQNPIFSVDNPYRRCHYPAWFKCNPVIFFSWIKLQHFLGSAIYLSYSQICMYVTFLPIPTLLQTLRFSTYCILYIFSLLHLLLLTFVLSDSSTP